MVRGTPFNFQRKKGPDRFTMNTLQTLKLFKRIGYETLEIGEGGVGSSLILLLHIPVRGKVIFTHFKDL